MTEISAGNVPLKALWTATSCEGAGDAAGGGFGAANTGASTDAAFGGNGGTGETGTGTAALAPERFRTTASGAVLVGRPEDGAELGADVNLLPTCSPTGA